AEEELAIGQSAHCAGEDATAFQLHEVGDEIRIDGGARLTDVAQYGFIIAVNEIRKLWTNVTTLTAHLVALGTLGLFAKENLSAARPTTALQFRDGPCSDGFRLLVGDSPRKQDAAQRQGAWSRVLLRRPCYIELCSDARRKRHFYGNQLVLSWLDCYANFLVRRQSIGISDLDGERHEGCEREDNFLIGQG